MLIIDALPIHLKKRIEMISSPEELSAILIERHAGFHKTCTASFNKQKLERKRKIFHKQQSNAETNNDGPSGKMTRLGIELKNFSNSCFFCEKSLMKGFFTVRKRNRVFSNMGIDQAHGQNNMVV